MTNRLITDISQPFWCKPAHGEFEFERAILGLGGPAVGDSKPAAWLDVLFEGGIVLPECGASSSKENVTNGRALTMLITGPPGTGKSTLALELCYRLASPQRDEAGQKRISSFFITSETTASRIQAKAKEFNWKHRKDVFVDLEEFPNKAPSNVVTVWEMSRLKEHLFSRLPVFYKRAISTLLRWGLRADDEFDHLVAEAQEEIADTLLRERLSSHNPELLVIDSLNTMPAVERPDLFQRFIDLATFGPKIVVIVLDSSPGGKNAEFWEYVSDIVLSLDKTYVSDYLVRTIAIKKARHQAHVWGVQQLKIYSGARPEEMDPHARRRAHPYRREGGIFIFPSIHFYLSSYKRLGPTGPPAPVATPLAKLNHVLKGGFPKGRCTAFIGKRGGHKSHLAYLHLLNRVVDGLKKGKDEPKEGALVISLRDDEGMAKRTMGSILTQQLRRDEKELDTLIDSGRLDILYYPPGYITPEEFYHRMYLSAQRMKRSLKGGAVTLVFNSLDQLASRFPLCAREDIFVPGIIETLSAEEITSIFIAVEEPGQPPEQYGLLSMADLIVQFTQRDFLTEDYCRLLGRWVDHVKKMNTDELASLKKQMPEYYSSVVMSVVRYSGGQAAGGGGILELVEEGSDVMGLYGEARLFFTPLSGLPSTLSSTADPSPQRQP